MYALDTKAAKEADQISAYLTDSGKYKGKFIRAEKLVSANKGTHGVGFTFADDSGQSTRFDIWTMDAASKQLMGYKSLMAIMVCLRVKELSVSKGPVERFDYDTRTRHTEEADVFTELTGKPIGLLLRNTEYEKMRDGHKTGETGWRLELYAPFDAASELTASEILDRKTQPEQLPKLLAGLADRPLRKTGGTVPAHAGQAPSSGGPGLDDDIPFSPIPRKALYAI